MADLDSKFRAAVAVIQGLPPDGSFQPSNEMKLKFYGLYKQARQGECNEPRPGFWDLIARQKYDAWSGLREMTPTTAKEQYIDTLKQIIETINLNSDVEKFIEVLGPFYEYVEEGQIMAKNPHLAAAAKTSQATLKELHSHDNLAIGDCGEDLDIQRMLGQFMDGSEKDLNRFLEDSAKDCNENWDEHSRLMEEVRWTKENLEQTMLLLKDCVNSNQEAVVAGQESRADYQRHEERAEEKVDNHRPEEGVDFQRQEEVPDKDSPLSQVELDRLLDNVDGFLPPTQLDRAVTVSSGNFYSTQSSLVFSPHAPTCDSDSEHDEEFQDTLDDLEDSTEIHHVDVHVSSMDNSPHSSYRPPTVPRVHARSKSRPRVEEMEIEEDEILLVSSCQPASPISTAVERMEEGVQQLRCQLYSSEARLSSTEARVSSLETILSLKQQLEPQPQSSGWLFPGMAPRSVLFLVTWPLLAQGLVYLSRAALRRARR